jgi:drug/metabolite transporter (DMT)-like permease
VSAAHSGRRVGFVALAVAIVCFSLGSTLVKLSETEPIPVAFWRMVLCSVLWMGFMRMRDGRWLSVADLRAALVPGVLFGLNITAFFSGVFRTSVAHAEFIGALTPIIVIPASAVLFHERMSKLVPVYGAVALGGLFVVLRFGASKTDANWRGDAIVCVAVTLWAGYLLTSRRLRQGRSVTTVMAAITPIASVVILPLLLIDGHATDLSARSWVFIGLLTVVTGTTAHGLIVFAQKAVPLSTISLLQVAQPALAVLWSVLLLSAPIRPIQLVGMAVVIGALVCVSVESQRRRE